jgi:hypothetical protein
MFETPIIGVILVVFVICTISADWTCTAKPVAARGPIFILALSSFILKKLKAMLLFFPKVNGGWS